MRCPIAGEQKSTTSPFLSRIRFDYMIISYHVAPISRLTIVHLFDRNFEIEKKEHKRGSGHIPTYPNLLQNLATSDNYVPAGFCGAAASTTFTIPAIPG
jgi:hypothetical protein